jgi:hypothetical protein
MASHLNNIAKDPRIYGMRIPKDFQLPKHGKYLLMSSPKIPEFLEGESEKFRKKGHYFFGAMMYMINKIPKTIDTFGDPPPNLTTASHHVL